MALGWLEKMLWVNPALNLTVASMGYDLGGSEYCGEAYMPGAGWIAGMDSVYPMSIGWTHLQPLVQPTSAQQEVTAREIAAWRKRRQWAQANGEDANTTVAKEMAAGYKAFVEAQEAERRKTNTQSKRGTEYLEREAPHMDVTVPNSLDQAKRQQHLPEPAATNAVASPLAPKARNLRRLAGRLADAANKNNRLNSTRPKFGEPGWVDSSGGGGSCQCYCPPTQGFGACKQLPAGADP